MISLNELLEAVNHSDKEHLQETECYSCQKDKGKCVYYFEPDSTASIYFLCKECIKECRREHDASITALTEKEVFTVKIHI